MGDAYINTEQMQRAACTFDNAVDQLNRIINSFSEHVWTLVPLLGQGYGNNLEELIQLLKERQQGVPASMYLLTKVARIEKYSVNSGSQNFKHDLCRIIDVNNPNIIVGAGEEFESELAAYRYANSLGYVIK